MILIRCLIPILLISFTLTGCGGHSPSSTDNPDNPVDVDPGELTRSYPAVIRGLWEPGAWDRLATFVGNQSGVDRLKSLGINTVSVLASFDVLDNGEYRFQSGRLEMVKEEESSVPEDQMVH